jgi:hypothetical protein
MKRIAPIEFIYRSKTYYALMRRRFSHAEGQYHVTVMNSGLETLLYGNDILITDEDGRLHSAGCMRDHSAKELIECIIRGIEKYMQENRLPVNA